PFLRDMSFSVGIAGIMQTQVVSTKDYMGTLNRCAELPDQYFSQCVASMANGLMEHGSPQKEYARAQEICELPLVSERGASKYCWREFTARLARFYDTETRASICSEVPSDVRSACLGKARSK
ncbi:hypothetical protein HY417_03465, partial [Candidatus Kaiserbacteria bacterium]|nr:hypothetical protein [Candidatus Kaiserbacteria bacterium]